MRTLLFVIALSGCTPRVAEPSTERDVTQVEATTTPREPAIDLGPPAPGDLPAPAACEQDADCTMVSVAPDHAHPCCERTVTIGYYSTAYLRAVEEFRARACASARCPTLDLPGAQPAACARSARCRDGQCVSSCDESP